MSLSLQMPPLLPTAIALAGGAAIIVLISYLHRLRNAPAQDDVAVSATKPKKAKKLWPHNPLWELVPGRLYIVDGEFSGPPQRRMTIFVLSDGSVAIHAPILVDDATQAQIASLGRVAYLIIPNGFHREDAAAYKDLYPHAKILCPAGARARVIQEVPVDDSVLVLRRDHAMDFPAIYPIPGWNKNADEPFEVVFEFNVGNYQVAYVVTDMLFNVNPNSVKGAISKAIMTMFGSYSRDGAPVVSRLSRTFFIQDINLVANYFENRSRQNNIRFIIPAHGNVIADQGSAPLARTAAFLRQ